MLTPGTVLAGRYEIVGRIGAGGMSNVYKARDLKLNRYVAIKVLKPEFSVDESFIQKFRVEAQSAAGLSHPNIVNVYDVGEENGVHYIVMELVQGITLKHYIERKGTLDIREVLNISVQVASGMGAAHANRIIHRDIKPQNVIMSRDGKVKVTDFGIAKAADSTTVTTNAAGSVHYISPEQARGGYSDEKSDIYSLGITMYEMVTGRVPYDGENNVSVALQHIQGNMTPPRQLNPDIPRSVERIILKCTMKKPDLRYASAKDLIMDLRRALAEPDGKYVTIGSPVMPTSTAKGVGEGTTVIMNENDIEHLRRASVNAGISGAESVVRKSSERKSAEERQRRALEEERREYEEYEEYDNHHERKRPKKQPMITDSDDSDEEVSPALDKTMTVFGIIGALIIIVVIGFIVARATGLFGGISTNTKETKDGSNITTESDYAFVPDCVGRSQEEAADLLLDAGLEYKIKEVQEDGADIGVVLRQTPEMDAKVDKGTIVTLYVNVAKETEEVPDVVGMSLDYARKQIEALGLKVKVENVFSDTVDENDIVKTSPKKGEEVKLGSTVTLYVSKGKETKTVEMPKLVGKDIDDAKDLIKKAKLEVGSIDEEYSDTYGKDKVTWQSETPGDEIKEGTKINLTISLGPKETEPPQTEANTTGYATVKMPMDSPMGGDLTDATITLEVVYSDGSVSTVYNNHCSSPDDYNSSWSTTVTGELGTNATVVAYVNGTQYATYKIYFS